VVVVLMFMLIYRVPGIALRACFDQRSSMALQAHSGDTDVACHRWLYDRLNRYGSRREHSDFLSASGKELRGGGTLDICD